MENSNLVKTVLDTIEEIHDRAKVSINQDRSMIGIGVLVGHLQILKALSDSQLTLQERQKVTDLARKNYDVQEEFAKKYNVLESIDAAYKIYQDIKERCEK
jgi:hypothetical protein